MALQPLTITDTRFAFRPLSRDFIRVVRAIDEPLWERPTAAAAWRAGDVLAHLTDTALRRVSFQRDRHPPPPPRHPFTGEADLVRFVNELNAAWVTPMRRLSPALLIDLFELASARLADLMESLPLDAPPLFPVSWAGADGDHGWLDIGRDFTEQWHHQMQIRDAVDAPAPSDPGWLHAVLLIALRGLPHAYRESAPTTGTAMVIEIGGASGGVWTLRRDAERWTLWTGEPGDRPADARIMMSDDTAWRLLFNGLPADQARTRIHGDGDPALRAILLRARSVIV